MTTTASKEVGGLAEQWSSYCRLLEDLGRSVLTEDRPETGRDAAEGFAHLAEQTVCWLTWAVGNGDPRHPTFQRQNDLFTQWGGPNVDNVYRHARIDPSLRYRIAGKMHGCQEFILAVRAGFMHMEQWGTVQEITASAHGIAEGSDFELLLGGDGTDPAFTPLDPRGIMASIREYYFDWEAREPAIMTIECLDADEPLPVADPSAMAERIAEAAYITGRSIGYWRTYLREARAAHADNTFEPPKRVAKGLDVARYAFCFYNLGPDEALVVESTVPDARYWSVQLSTLHWYHSFDSANRFASLNQTQISMDDDGKFRFVVAHADPGMPNWLDAEGRPEGLITYRWFWGTADPLYSARVVPLADVADHAPGGTHRIEPPERAAALAARRRHAAWRFRT